MGEEAGEVEREREREREWEREREREEERIWREVEILRGMRTEGEVSLRHMLSHLSALSAATTRRLDYTYYALLTSLSNLTSTVHALHALARSFFGLHRWFQGSVTELENKTGVSIAATTQTLDRQAERATDLQRRMQKSRSKVEELGKRLEKVRSKVVDAQRRDGEGRIRVGRRWKVFSSLGCCCLLFLAIALVARRWNNRQESSHGERVSSGALNGRSLEVVNETAGPAVGNSVIADLVSSAVVRAAETAFTVPANTNRKGRTSDMDAEATLRLFEEL
ncbi:MAG: hypothetical protein Q9163_006423 [Psora crenata]